MGSSSMDRRTRRRSRSPRHRREEEPRRNEGDRRNGGGFNKERRRGGYEDRGDQRPPKGFPGDKNAEEAEEEDKQKPNFEVTGKLLEDTNMYNGVIVKYSEPEDAQKPKTHWRFYVFKGEETLPILHLHRQSAFLMGRDRKVADIPIDHPSCSKQHAAFQYRFKNGSVIPYIIDLESSNGTYLNNKKIEPKRYYELREKDVIKFGFSSREYVLLNDQSSE